MFSLVVKNLRNKRLLRKLSLEECLYSFVYIFRKEEVDLAKSKAKTKVYLSFNGVLSMLCTTYDKLDLKHGSEITKQRLINELYNSNFYITACNMTILDFNITSSGGIVVDMPSGILSRVRINIGLIENQSKELVCLV